MSGPRKKNDRPTLKRRELLAGAGAMGLGALVSTPAAVAKSVMEDDVDPPVLDRMCELAPASTAGPFYLDLDLLRRDISEGLDGFRMSVFLKVVRFEDCSPIENAVVDLWHCDAIGRYSGFAQEGTEGETFCRGIQVTNGAGLVRFDTIFPGWYVGRTTHFHFKVRLSNSELVTSQLYFADEIPDQIYERRAPYRDRGIRDTRNSSDFGYREELELTVRRPYAGLVIGVASD